jgi:hypothetical protein
MYRKKTTTSTHRENPAPKITFDSMETVREGKEEVVRNS